MRNLKAKPFWILRELFNRLLVIVGSVILTLIFFLVLPLMQTIAKPPTTDLVLQTVETAKLEAPPPPPEEEEKEEPQEEQAPPELSEDVQPLDLSQLELTLNPGFREGSMSGDFAVKLNTGGSDSKSVDDLFSISDLDQTARVVYQPGPSWTKEMRKKAPGKVEVIFIVDSRGRVENPIVQKSSDPVFEKPALACIKQWKFEPGKHNGQAVRFRMRVPMTFPKER